MKELFFNNIVDLKNQMWKGKISNNIWFIDLYFVFSTYFGCKELFVQNKMKAYKTNYKMKTSWR